MNGSFDNIPSTLVHTGSYGSVVFAVGRSKSCPCRAFWDERSIEEKAKFMTLFQKITSARDLTLFNREQFKQVEGELFEFKRNDLKMRIFAFRDGKNWCLVMGMTGKKEDELPRSVVERARQLTAECKSVLEEQKRRYR